MAEELKIKLNTTSVAGTDDYNLLFNHPKINGVEVSGEKSLDDYDIKKKSEANAEHTEINAAISSETERAEAAEKANADAITQEVADRKAADSVLNDAINAETTRAQAAEKVNSDAITQEVADRKSADSALNDSIQAEAERAQAAETANSNSIVKEVTDRTTAISNVEEALATETATRISADNTFSAHVANAKNPHNVTKAQVGLGNVDNTADVNKNVQRAVYVGNSLITAKEYFSPDNRGFGKYLLIYDVTDWKSSKGQLDISKTFLGVVISTRIVGQIGVNDICNIDIGCSYAGLENGKPIISDNDSYLRLRTSSNICKPAILKNTTDSKYYLSLYIYGSGRDIILLGNFNNTDVLNEKWILCSDANGTLPSGWEVYSEGYKIIPAEIAKNSLAVNGHTVNSDVPADAKFTDTTYEVATQTANGLMSSSDKTKLDSLSATDVSAITNSEIDTIIKS